MSDHGGKEYGEILLISSNLGPTDSQVQVQFLQDLYAKKDIDPSKVLYCEMDCPLSEMRAVEAVLCTERSADASLLIGSIRDSRDISSPLQGMESLLKICVAGGEKCIPMTTVWKDVDMEGLRKYRVRLPFRRFRKYVVCHHAYQAVLFFTCVHFKS
jgi:hypothetical protein